jgi:outer membrane receptor protein involved in Fe transport
MKKHIPLIASVFGVLTIFPTHAFGQAIYGSIFGTVGDQAGRPIPNAKVTLVNLAKGTKRETISNESGNYALIHLIPDKYALRIAAMGFNVVEWKSITVAADVALRTDAQLQIGKDTVVRQSSGTASQLKTDRADVAVVFDQKTLQELPLLDRNFTSLEYSSPGTQKLSGWSHAATENPQGGQQIFVNGQHFSGTGYELDGTDNQDPILGIIVINPNLDSLAEAKWTLQNYDAEFGKAISGIMAAQTKSGSNTLHGSGFWFRRSDATQARDPFTQFQKDSVTGRFIPSTMWNQFGGSLGGPLIKNKLFFFGDYQGTRRKTGLSFTATVPTQRVHDTCLQTTGFCDLSEYGSIYDPATGTPEEFQGGDRRAFPNSLIPNARISPPARKILELFPLPNTIGINGGTSDNFIASGFGPFDDNTFDTRIDYQASNTLHIFGRYSHAQFSLSGQPMFGAKIGGPGFGEGGFAGVANIHNRSVAAGFDKGISASLLTDFRFGYFKYHPEVNKFDVGTSPANDFGIGAATGNLLNTGDKLTSGLPVFIVDDIWGFGSHCPSCPVIESEQQFQFVNNWTKISGNHQFKFGADVRYAMNLRIESSPDRTGGLIFSHRNTSHEGDGGNGLATFLLGNVTSFFRTVNTPGTIDAAERQKRMFFYSQDIWRATPRLTINYGLRWELYFPESVNGKGKGGFANIEQGVIRVAGYGPYGTNGNIDMRYTAFAPRLGIAYQLNPKTVVRMGYGRSFDLGVFGSLFGHTVTANLPVLVAQNVNAQNNVNPNASIDYIAAFTLANGPPAAQFPSIPADGELPLQGPKGDAGTQLRPTFMRLPTVDAWNLTLQHQFTNSIVAEIAYVGNKGTHVFTDDGPDYNANQPSIVGFLEGVPQAQRRPLFNKFTYPGFLDASGNILQCCSNDVIFLASDASNNYNALQATFSKRFSRGLQVMAYYTWAKSPNYSSDYYVNDPRLGYGPEDNIRNQVFVADIFWELPFGKGKMFGSHAGGVLNRFIAGWQINSSANWSSGLPWTPTYFGCDSDIDTGPCRPNRVGPFSTGVGSFDPFTHTVAFYTPVNGGNGLDNGQSAGGWQRPLKGQFGNAGRNSLRGPPLFTSDMSLLKNIPISERVKAQFRVDASNVFNHPALGLPFRCIDCGGDIGGKITGLEVGTNMRRLQFAVRFTF